MFYRNKKIMKMVSQMHGKGQRGVVMCKGTGGTGSA